MTNKSTVRRFYEIEQAKLFLDFEKVALFTDHGPSIGSFREHRLQQFMRDFTPKSLEVGSGFVSHGFRGTGQLTDEQSRQIDCLVYDRLSRQPFLEADNYVIVEPAAIYAAIEVKSALTFHRTRREPAQGSEEHRWGGTLVEALTNVAALARMLGMERHSIFLGIFAFSMSFDWKSFYAALDGGELLSQLDLNHVDLFPNAICVPGKALIAIGPWDLTERQPHHDPYTSHFNYFAATDECPALPLQMFSTWYTNQVAHRRSGRVADEGGMFSVSEGTMSLWCHHFDLASDGHED